MFIRIKLANGSSMILQKLSIHVVSDSFAKNTEEAKKAKTALIVMPQGAKYIKDLYSSETIDEIYKKLGSDEKDGKTKGPKGKDS